MRFILDLSKPAQEIIFSCKSKRPTHSPLVFNDKYVSQSFFQKQVTVTLDFKLTFADHFNNVLAKVNKIIGLLCKLRDLLPGTTIIAICKAFVWLH